MDDFFKKNLTFKEPSPGYILVGGVDEKILCDFLEKTGEVRFFSGAGGIDEMRRLKESVLMKTAEEKTFYVLNSENLGYFAFPVLLKIIEDAPAGRYFVVLARSADNLPATLRSRLLEIFAGRDGAAQKNIKEFVAAGFGDRIKLIERFSSGAEDFNSFLDEAEVWARDNRDFDFLSRCQRVRESSRALNISRKMCLEYLSQFAV